MFAARIARNMLSANLDAYSVTRAFVPLICVGLWLYLKIHWQFRQIGKML